MAKGKKNIDSALVTESDAQDNPHLQKVINALKEGYNAHRVGKSNSVLNLKKHRVAMVPNERSVWVFGKDNGVREMFRAGWYLSIEENAIKEELLKDPKIKELNETIWGQMEAAGMSVDKLAGKAGRGTKVVSGVV